ncbi:MULTISPECIES: hypothetical protein [Streptosporangiaceae]
MFFIVPVLVTVLCAAAVVFAVLKAAVHYHRTKPSQHAVDAARARLNTK